MKYKTENKSGQTFYTEGLDRSEARRRFIQMDKDLDITKITEVHDAEDGCHNKI